MDINRGLSAFALALVFLLASSGGTQAQSGGSYDLSWSVIAGGGGSSVGGAGAEIGAGYRVDGTFGQSDTAILTAGDYVLAGGFWNRLADPLVGVNHPGGDRPTVFSLHAIQPNPSFAAARIGFDLPRESRTELAVFAIDGRRVRSLANSVLPAGRHSVNWDGADDDGRRVSPGVYLVRFETRSFSAVRRLIRLN